MHCVDDSDHVSSFQRPRGKGGTAILWHNSLDDHVKPVTEGNEHITCAELITAADPILLISVYLPTRGYATSKADYALHISTLEAIVKKYQSTHVILIGGDMNASIQRGDVWDNVLVNFIQNCDLCCDDILEDTFIHHSGKARSKIDYFIGTLEVLDCKCFILDSHPNNTSSHLPIVVTFKAEFTQDIKENKPKVKPKVKYRWDKADVYHYQEHVDELVASWIDELDTVNCAEDLEIAVDKFARILLDSADRSVPVKVCKLRGPRFKATPGLMTALRNSKNTFKTWDQEGRPPNGASSHKAMRHSKTIVRKELRQIAALQRQNLYSDLMDGPGNRLFHTLINQQLKQKNCDPTVIVIDNQEISDVTAQADALAEYYEELATPASKDNYDDTFYMETKRDNVCILQLLEHAESTGMITTQDVNTAINDLHTKRASDGDNLMAEHLIKAKDQISPAIAMLLRKLQELNYLPTMLKSGYVLSIPKKGKDPKHPSGHRGITISSVLSKVVESVYKVRHEETQLFHQDELQFGFSKGYSPVMAALIVTELIGEAKSLNRTIYIASLDARKAFDVVDHNILLHTLYDEGCDLDAIRTFQELYSGLRNKVVWRGQDSKEYDVKQGVRQGGVWSATLYKSYVNGLLSKLRSGDLGAKIGAQYLGSPTVADDLLLVSYCVYELQCMFDLSGDYADQRRYDFQPSKTVVISIKPDARSKDECVSPVWTVRDEEVTVKDSLVHVGIPRFSSNVPDTTIDTRINTASKCAYALMGTGLHGYNGIGAKTSLQIIKTYVLPRLLYGLEVMLLSRKQIDVLSTYYNGLLKQIQGLPMTTATCAVYLLLGTLPVEALLDLRRLSLIGAICRSRNQCLRDLASRQLAMRSARTSWFPRVESILEKYELPSIDELMDLEPDKERWKARCKDAVNSFWYQYFISEMKTKSSLQYLNPPLKGECHPCWDSVDHTTKDVQRATIKARLLTSRYVLQTTRARFNQNEVDSRCQLCLDGDEDLHHFLLKCDSLESVRMRDMRHITDSTASCGIDFRTEDDGMKLQLILDSSKIVDKTGVVQIERASRRLCFSLHCRRMYLLEELSKATKSRKKPTISVSCK